MHQPFSLPAGNRVKNRRQAYALLLLGVVFLFIAWLGILNPYAVGVVLFGLGMLAVAPLNPRRYLSAGWLTTSLGVATFLMFRIGQPGPDRPSSCHWTGAARHCMDGSARLHKQRRTDTRTLRCRCGSHRIFASSTSHSFSPGSFRAFPLAAWVRPLCAWTGCSGDERKHIHQRRAPPGGPCSLWKGTSRSCEGLHQALTLLTSRERTVIILRYGIGDDGLALAFALVAHPQLFQACCG